MKINFMKKFFFFIFIILNLFFLKSPCMKKKTLILKKPSALISEEEFNQLRKKSIKKLEILYNFYKTKINNIFDLCCIFNIIKQYIITLNYDNYKYYNPKYINLIENIYLKLFQININKNIFNNFINKIIKTFKDDEINSGLNNEEVLTSFLKNQNYINNTILPIFQNELK